MENLTINFPENLIKLLNSQIYKLWFDSGFKESVKCMLSW